MGSTTEGVLIFRENWVWYAYKYTRNTFYLVLSIHWKCTNKMRYYSLIKSLQMKPSYLCYMFTFCRRNCGWSLWSDPPIIRNPHGMSLCSRFNFALTITTPAFIVGAESQGCWELGSWQYERGQVSYFGDDAA